MYAQIKKFTTNRGTREILYRRIVSMTILFKPRISH